MPYTSTAASQEVLAGSLNQAVESSLKPWQFDMGSQVGDEWINKP